MKPFLHFLRRTWLLAILSMLAVLACLNDRIFLALGSLIYIPAAVLLASLLARIIITLAFSRTIDADSRDGTFAREWRATDPEFRLALTVIIKAAFFLGVAIIVASFAK